MGWNAIERPKKQFGSRDGQEQGQGEEEGDERGAPKEKYDSARMQGPDPRDERCVGAPCFGAHIPA